MRFNEEEPHALPRVCWDQYFTLRSFTLTRHLNFFKKLCMRRRKAGGVETQNSAISKPGIDSGGEGAASVVAGAQSHGWEARGQ